MREDYNFLNHNTPAVVRPDGAEVFIQWKASDVFIQFTCECGKEGTFEGFFAHVLKCGGCGQEWEMPAHLYPRKRCEKTYPGHVAKELEYDEETNVKE